MPGLDREPVELRSEVTSRYVVDCFEPVSQYGVSVLYRFPNDYGAAIWMSRPNGWHMRWEIRPVHWCEGAWYPLERDVLMLRGHPPCRLVIVTEPMDVDRSLLLLRDLPATS